MPRLECAQPHIQHGQSNEEAFSVAVSASIFNLNEQDDAILEQNFNLESKLCEGFLRAKSSKNKLDLFMYMISLGRFCLSLKKCDEYMFVCIKHLLEIFDSNENDKWTAFMSSLAQRQLFIISKRINMQELFGEFEEKGKYLLNSLSPYLFNPLPIMDI